MNIPLACVANDIPADERAAHFALIKMLFRESAPSPKQLLNGMSFEFLPEHLEALGHFIRNERKCCPFLTFDLSMRSRSDRVTLTITGPAGTTQFLTEELLEVG